MAAITASAPRQAAGQFNQTLHGARGFLALLVFLFHIAASGAPGFAWQIAGLGHAVLVSFQFGVEIFFSISGFVIVGTLQRAPGPGAFLRNRAMRILPVLWLTIAVLLPLGLATHQGVFATLDGRDLAWVVPANLVPLAGAFPVPLVSLAAWSLSYELLFYLIAAALWWLPQPWRLTRFAVIAVAIGLIVWHPRALFFVVGVLLARPGLIDLSSLRPATRAPGVMLGLFFATWYLVEFGAGRPSGTMLDWLLDGRIGLAALAVGFAALAFSGLVAGQGWLSQLLRTGPMQWLGTLSYSFYLWHIIVIGVAKRGLALADWGGAIGPWSQVALVCLCLPIALVIAHFSVRYVEQGVSSRLQRQFRVATV